MRIFGIGPIPLLLRSQTPIGPTAPMLKTFDVFYTDDPVIGVDVVPSCDYDSQCSFYVEQYVCDFGMVGLNVCCE